MTPEIEQLLLQQQVVLSDPSMPLEGKSLLVSMGCKLLAQQTEIERLALELTQKEYEIRKIKDRSSKRNLRQIMNIAPTLTPHKYGPYALKSIVEAAVGVPVADQPPLPQPLVEPPPEGFPERVKEAKANGFVWDVNNRKPSKLTTQVRKIEEWERDYSKVYDHMTLDQIAQGALKTRPELCAGIKRLAEEVGEDIDFKPGTNLTNKYRKMIEEWEDSGVIRRFVDDVFSHLPEEEKDRVTEMFETRGLSVNVMKRLMCKSLLPPVGGKIVWDEEDYSPDQKLASIYHGDYDKQFQSLIDEYLSE